MNTVVTIDVPNGTAEQYERITAKVFPEGKVPQGWLLHLAGPTAGGWRVVNVVPSQEDFEVFLKEKLLPAAAGEGDSPPTITFNPVHTLIRP